jgi:spore coat protein U-like protein
MRKYSIAPITAGILLALAGSAHAASKTTSFVVSANVNANCFVSATPLNFGSYTGVAVLQSTSSVNVRCTNGAAYTLKLNAGNGTFAQRLLSDGGSNTLQYNLFSNAARTTIWGDGSASTAVVTGSGTGLGIPNQTSHTVYGELADSTANQNVPSGTYTDTITVTIEY